MTEWLFNITWLSWMSLKYLWSFKSVHQLDDLLQIILLWLTILTHTDHCRLLSAAQWGWSCILRGWIWAAYDQRPRVFILFTFITIFFHLPRVQHLEEWRKLSQCSKGWRTNLTDRTSWLWTSRSCQGWLRSTGPCVCADNCLRERQNFLTRR